MGLEFKTKSNRRECDPISKQLCSFLLRNKDFIEITFILLSEHTSETKHISSYILHNLNYPDIEYSNNLETYHDLMENFYTKDIEYSNSNIDIIAYRRGDLLELLVNEITPLVMCIDFNVIPESHVYENGTKIHDKDVDLITELKDYNKIECIECKANINNYIGNPIDDDTKDKLNFMCMISDKSNSYGVGCDLLFATYRSDISYTKDLLLENSFDNFKIMNSVDLIQRLNAKRLIH
ncbi:hypothetical protein [Paraclostridium sordellii]|uniref:Uncharacterized protein n=1 Tax=Paraclostridium sordellii TaxID=1505 RepID=A0A9P1KX56_PARSO|nr:hypothetical protein [Paeniclostridium sordellii]CEN31419.1 Uncharacterised protein [[Clostridium] sordellii] [Paeniclostridium sordellii]